MKSEVHFIHNLVVSSNGLKSIDVFLICGQTLSVRFLQINFLFCNALEYLVHCEVTDENCITIEAH